MDHKPTGERCRSLLTDSFRQGVLLAADFSEFKMKKTGVSDQCWISLLRIPDRVDTAILFMMLRRKAFTVFGLTFMRTAISLLVSPNVKWDTVSSSRSVKRNSRAMVGTSGRFCPA